MTVWGKGIERQTARVRRAGGAELTAWKCRECGGSEWYGVRDTSGLPVVVHMQVCLSCRKIDARQTTTIEPEEWF